MDARLYKLLIYERGGFFSAHRDTEKEDGMVATLVISLPVAGSGGELIVRHGEREAVIDMRADEPSEVAFAAFYADCVHETRPVLDGHRLSLVFNLCLRAGGSDTPAQAPDYTEQEDEIAHRLIQWGNDDSAADKLVWLLEHEYSEAGLSFAALKNRDAALAQVLAPATERADCELYAAIVHIEEVGSATIRGDYVDSWNWNPRDVDDMQIDEIYDSVRWLAGWTRLGSSPPFGKIPLRANELLPSGALDDADPDEQWLNEASGNEGVSLERAYRHAAFVIWPKSKTLNILAGADFDGAVAWVAEEFAQAGNIADERTGSLVSRLTDTWPPDSPYRHYRKSRVRMLELLAAIGDAAHMSRFLRAVTLARYRGGESAALANAMTVIGPEGAGGFVPLLVEAHFMRRPAGVIAFFRRLEEMHRDSTDGKWQEVLREGIRAMVHALSSPRNSVDRDEPQRQPSSKRIGKKAIRDLFVMAWRSGLVTEAETVAEAIAGHPGIVSSDRALPAVLKTLRAEGGFANTAAYAKLWRHAADFLLARSSAYPEEPGDWTIPASIPCSCGLCVQLKAFCKSPDSVSKRFPVRTDLRKHLHRMIDQCNLDIDHVTERRGRPFTLVCTKNRNGYKRRLAEYAEDILQMRSLIRSSPGGLQAAGAAPDIERLDCAVAASEQG